MVVHLQSRLRYEQMLAKSATAAICASADHLIISWNTSAEKLFGHSAEYALLFLMQNAPSIAWALTERSGQTKRT